MSHLRLFKSLAAAIVILAAIGLAYKWVTSPIRPHHGDGEFQDVSFRAGPFWVSGYSITFPVFDLAKGFDATYRLAEVPQIGKKCGLYLKIIDDADALDRNADKFDTGDIRIELLDSHGTTVLKVNGKPKDFVWSTAHAARGWDLYQLDRSFFEPRPSEEYVVRVSYSPDTGFTSIKGCIYIRCGGSM